MAPPEVLIVTTVLPTRPTGGESVTLQVIETLRDLGARVTVVGFARPGDTCTAPPGTTFERVETRAIESGQARARAVWWGLRALLTGRPYSETKYRSRRLLRTARARAAKADVVLIDHLQLAWIAPHLARANAALIEHNHEAGQYAALAKLARGRIGRWIYRREARLLGRIEAAVAQRVARTVFLSEEDRDAVAATLPVIPPDWSAVTPPSIAVPATEAAGKSPERRHDVLLFGNWNWSLNRAGLQWFLDAVLPELRTDIRCAVAGAGLPDIRSERVDTLGFVPDLAVEAQHARVLAVPSIAGTGVQIKTLQAIAYGRPVVCTDTALRGLGEAPGFVQCATDGPAFARALEAALDTADSDHREPARQWLRERHERFSAEWDRLLRQLAGGSPAAHAPEASCGDPPARPASG